MSDKDFQVPVAHLVDLENVETLDVLGPKVEFLTRPEGSDDTPCVMRGTIPPGGVVPLHSHADPETFLALEGEVEGLVHYDDDSRWVRICPGDVFHVPGGAKHAFRNPSKQPAVNIIVSTAKIGRFFREIGTPAGPEPATSRPPTDEELEHFLATAERYGYWNATPEENAKIGISLPTS